MPENFSSLIQEVMGAPEGVQPIEETETGLAPSHRPKLLRAMERNPDSMADVHEIAESRRVSASSVELNLDDIKKQERLDKLNSLQNPALTRFLTNQQNADVAHDDIEVLSQIEDHVRAFAAGVVSLPQMIAGGAAAGIEAGTRLTEKALPDEWAQALNEVDMGVLEGNMPSDLLRWEESQLKGIAEGVKPDATGTSIEVAGALGQVTAQIGQMILAPQTSFPSLFAQNISQQEQRQIESGAEHTVAADVALISSGGLAVIERFGLEKLLARVPLQIQNRIARKLTDVVIGGGYEAATEVLENLGHSLVEYMSTNPDADFTKGIVQEAKVGGITGAIIKALIPSYKGSGVRSQATQEVVENKTEAEQRHIDETITFLQKGKLAKRDAKAFKRYVDELPKNTEFKVSPEAFESFEGEIPSFIQEQLDVVGSDVIIPLDKLGTDVVNNPELLTTIRPHMRMSDDTMTQSEVDAGGSTTVENMMREATESAEITSEAEAVTDDVVNQLVATDRLSKNNAKHAAAVIESYVVTKAHEMGMGAKEVFDKMNLTIKKADKAPPSFGDEMVTQEIVVEGTGQKGKVREKKQVVYDRKLKQQQIVTKLRDCVNG